MIDPVMIVDSVRNIPSLERLYFIGIGGVGMSALARIFHARGVSVSGSDIVSSVETDNLREIGVRVFIGHHQDNISQSKPSAVIISKTAIADNNTELVYAMTHNIPVIYRSDLLARLAREYISIAVTGTHGKTSTTAMIVSTLLSCGKDPACALGGIISGLATGSRTGSDGTFIFEADESDGSLLNYRPSIAVITNIDPDHLDYFGSAAAYCDIFAQFLRGLDDDATVIISLDNSYSRDLLAAEGSELISRGITILGYTAIDTPLADVEQYQVARILNYHGTSSPVLVSADVHGIRGDFPLLTPGIHMAANALAAILAVHKLGIDVDYAYKGISTYKGSQRRFEFKGCYEDIDIYDDYAHHPTEISAVLTAAKALVRSGRIGVVFQPHLYSRTQLFAQEFALSLTAADQVWLLDVYPAREKSIPGVSSESIARFNPATLKVLQNKNSLLENIALWAKPHDIIITMGAGDVTCLGPQILEALRIKKR